MRAIAFDIEQAGKAGDLFAVRTYMVGLEAAFERLKEEITVQGSTFKD